MLDAASLRAVQGVASDTMFERRFVKREASVVATRYEHKASFGAVDEARDDYFAGRLSILKSDQVPTGYASEGRYLVRLTTPAGSVEFAAQDRFQDTLDGRDYEILGDLGTNSENAVVWEWFAARLN